jgi:putative ABC transport system permease protein
MPFFAKARSLLRNLFLARRVEAELDEEVRMHLEMLVEENVRAGMTGEEARRAARMELGGVDQVKERVHERQIGNWAHSVVADCRYAVRQLRKSPGFSAVAVLTLALSIGANTAVFSVVNGVLLRPMPFFEPDRLFLISYSAQHGPFEREPSLTDRQYLGFRDQNQTFESVAAFANSGANLTGAGDPVRIPSASVTTSFFRTLRTEPVLGRGFLADEDQAGRDNVVVISDKLWKERLAADPQILGKKIKLNGINRTVVGVMVGGFYFPNNAEVWLPLAVRVDPNNSFARPVVGRLKAGASQQLAQVELEAFVKSLPLDPGENRNEWLAQVVPLKELLVANVRESLLIFAGAVAFVLLIACANIANLFLARAAGREQEMAVRSALGAGRRRLVRQLLTESAMVSLAGGSAGVLLAVWGVPALLALAPEEKVPRVEMVRIDLTTLAFTFGLSLFTCVMFGLAPALRSTRREVREALKQGERTLTERHENVRKGLAIAETAIALILLAGAGLMLNSFLRLQKVDPGFRAENVVTMTVDLSETTYRTATQMQDFQTRTLERLSGLPGVLATGAVNWRPLGEALIVGSFRREGENGRVLRPGFMVDKPCVSPGYFRAMGIRLMQGREFTGADKAGAVEVVIVSQSVARSLWANENPIGKRISMEDEPKAGDWLNVVGVVDDVKQQGLGKKSDPAIYQPCLQAGHVFSLSHINFVAKTAANPESVAEEMRGIVRDVDKDQPIASIATMGNLMEAATAEPRFQARLLGVFAAAALVLAIVGVYGVLSYSVARRTHEIGIRMALGAHAEEVRRMMLGNALAIVGAGVAIGVCGALGLTRVLAKFLFEVKPGDPATLATVALTLIVTTLAACYIPARRASRVDPMVALRYE